ncbi:MAG: type III secretion system chaperone [Kiritimatiellae bacterium]|nr:type III secretion system chaperone [Kiritimatiellia bacterium]
MTFSDLLQLASERLGVEIEDAGGAAGVAIDGAPVVLQDAGDLLLLRADLGAIPAEGREAVLSAAMEANWLYQGTGGATLALDPAGGGLGLQKYTWLDRLDADAAFETLERFAATAAFWRKTLSDFVAPPASAEAPSPPPPSAGGFLV